MKRLPVCMVLLLALALPLFSRGSREVEPLPSRAPLRRESTFSIALLKSEETLYLDPIRATDSTSLMVLDGLFEGLFALDPKSGEPMLALAKEAKISPDGLIWTIILKDDIRFSNGDRITADSVVSSWLWLLHRARAGEGNTYLSSMLDCIEGVQAFRTGEGSESKVGLSTEGDNTIVIRLNSPAPYLPSLLSMMPFSAIHPSVRVEEQSLPFDEIISSGPYVIESYDGSSVLLAKHPWYADYQEVPSDYIEFSFMESASIVDSYLEKTLHWAVAYIPREVLHNPADMRISPQYSTGFYYFSANSGVYANAKIRRALDLLIPWEEIRHETGQLFPASRFIPHEKSITDPTPRSPEETEQEALGLLAEEGYPYGAGLPTLYMAVHRGAQVVESAERIADILSRKLGITVVIDSVPLSTYSRYPELSPYDLSFITWIGDFHDPFAFLSLFSRDSGYHLGTLDDGSFDTLLDQALAANDEQERTERIEAAENHLLESSVVFPLFHGFTINIIQHDMVQGWYDNLLDIHPVKHLGIR